MLYWAPLPELCLALGFVITALIISKIWALRVVFPSTTALQFTGMNYAVPFVLIFAWGLLTIITRRKWRLVYYLAGALAYCAILIFHFNVKMWMSIVNPNRWDGAYWRIDEAVRPLVDGSFAVHSAFGKVFGWIDHLYLFAFLAMFGCSIIVHSMRRFIVFRQVIFTSMAVHVLGALSYLIMPAVGPFIYEPGANALETVRQVHMYGTYEALMAGGRSWIISDGQYNLFAAVAAMPSLHVASSAVFLYYAARHERWLCWIYVPLFLFIVIEAVATRWHYIIDLVAGLGVTAAAIMLTAWIFQPIDRHHRERDACKVTANK